MTQTSTLSWKARLLTSSILPIDNSSAGVPNKITLPEAFPLSRAALIPIAVARPLMAIKL